MLSLEISRAKALAKFPGSSLRLASEELNQQA
jgi:hypothetical protein